MPGVAPIVTEEDVHRGLPTDTRKQHNRFGGEVISGSLGAPPGLSVSAQANPLMARNDFAVGILCASQLANIHRPTRSVS
jgi:hypothetical protein